MFATEPREPDWDKFIWVLVILVIYFVLDGLFCGRVFPEGAGEIFW